MWVLKSVADLYGHSMYYMAFRNYSDLGFDEL